MSREPNCYNCNDNGCENCEPDKSYTEAKQGEPEPECKKDKDKLQELLDDSKYFKEPEQLKQLKGTPFCLGGVNLIYGLSKAGKSTSLYQLLNKEGYGKEVIVLDADHNAEANIVALLNNFTWKNQNVMNLASKLVKIDLTGKIIVLDSLKDFVGKHELDGNKGSQAVMKRVRAFSTKGATVIVVAHATNSDLGIKIKGNEETIKSKSDVVIKFENHERKGRSFEITDSRFNFNFKKFTVDSGEEEELINVA